MYHPRASRLCATLHAQLLARAPSGLLTRVGPCSGRLCPPAAGHCQFPRRDDFLRAILRSGDAAAGPDGCPYECYRQLPDLSADILAQHFRDIVCGLAPPPVQALTFIPKADAGHYADNFRPLDMPDTAARLIDSAVFMCMMRSLPTSLHQAQALINTLKEAPANFLDIQDRLLDSTADSLVLLTDLAKAFERVNPGWLLQILTMLGVPHWVRQYSIHLLYGRRTLHRIQGFLLPPLSMRQGLAMGRASSVLLFCVAIDPLICALNRVPAVRTLKAYMDDNATEGQGSTWIASSQERFEALRTAGFQVLGHSCFSARPFSVRETCVPIDPALGLSALPEDVDFEAFVRRSEHLGAWCADKLPSLTALARRALTLCPTTTVVEVRWFLCSSGTTRLLFTNHFLRAYLARCHRPSPQLAGFLTASCMCKCKSAILSGCSLNHAQLWDIDAAPWGPKLWAPSATLLGFSLIGAPHGRGKRAPCPYLAR